MMTSSALLTMSVSLLFWGTFADYPQAQELSDIESPRLRALAAQLDAGNGNALNEFWEEMEVATTPIVEAIENSRDVRRRAP